MIINSPSSLGKIVRTIRKSLGINQSDLAMTAGTGPRFIVDLEKGKPSCEIGKTLHVLTMLGLTIDLRTPEGLKFNAVSSEGVHDNDKKA